jgi:hypothetical protein
MGQRFIAQLIKAIAQLFPLRLIVTAVFAGKWSLLSNRLKINRESGK